MSLREIIIEEIKNKGPLSFHAYMDMCLYHPEHGYYSSGPGKIGPRGDYYTSPCLGPLFGRLIATQLEEMWNVMGRKNFVIVEYGAGSGQLCGDILKAAADNKLFNDSIDYHVVERNAVPLPQQPPGKIKQHKDGSTIPELEGCILSNELIDNFCIDRVTKKQDLMEILVDYRQDAFKEVLRPARPELVNYFDELNVRLPEGFQTEINLQALQWMKEVAGKLKRGFVLTIDYGFPSQDLYNRNRSEGNIVCYYKHRLHHSLYENIGTQDITAHINFSALHHWGVKYGLNLTGFTTQSQFLMGLGISRQASMDPACVASPMMLRTLLVDMGNRMKVLIQQKNMPPIMLSGLRFPQRLS